jgi:hypothetical protein
MLIRSVLDLDLNQVLRHLHSLNEMITEHFTIQTIFGNFHSLGFPGRPPE